MRKAVLRAPVGGWLLDSSKQEATADGKATALANGLGYREARQLRTRVLE
jgi:hypothetical protein